MEETKELEMEETEEETGEEGTGMYTDQELYWATQIAYCNVHEFEIEVYKIQHGGEAPTLQEIFNQLGESVYYNQDLFDEKHQREGDELLMKESTQAFIEGVQKGTICKDWRIVSVRNQQDYDGMYGVTIETGKDSAIVAFRGSESVDTKQFIEDWLTADLDIIQGLVTEQEKSAFQYLDDMGQVMPYKNFAVTGHSLGGDLALVSTILSAGEDSKSDISDRISQSVSFDGPGHPQEFILMHSKEIHEMQDVMTHYQWSWVGAILTSPCKQSGRYFHIESDLFQDDDALLFKHSTASLEFGEDGSLNRVQDWDILAKESQGFTYAIDFLPMLQFDVAVFANGIQGGARISHAIYCAGVMAGIWGPDMFGNIKDWTIKENNKLGNCFLDILQKYTNALQQTNEQIQAFGKTTVSSAEFTRLFLENLSSFQNTEDATPQQTAEEVAEERKLQAVFLAGVMGGHPGASVHIHADVGAGSTADSMADRFATDSLKEADAAYTAAGSAIRYQDPLVIDLNRNGFEILSVEDGAYFDENHEGLREKTQWAAPDDALLAIDLNGDGKINDGSELFGTATLLGDGSLAKSGFGALAQHDGNGDGVIDERDAVFSNLLVWQDKNSDGISQQGELHTLQELGIASISLNYKDKDGINSADVTFTDGTATQIGEFTFESQLYDTKEFDSANPEDVLNPGGGDAGSPAESDNATKPGSLAGFGVPEEIRTLPNVRAIGNVPSLHTLMQRDETGTLKAYVEQFAQSSSASEKEETVTKMLYFITGAQSAVDGSRGLEFDAKKLWVIEQVMGRDFTGSVGSNPVDTAAALLEKVYANIFEVYYNLLNAQTALKDFVSMTFWTVDESGKRCLNTGIFDAYISDCVKEGKDMRDTVAEMGRYLMAMNPENPRNYMDYVHGHSGSIDYLEAIEETSRGIVVLGTEKNDFINAGARGDIIYGGNGNDDLHGFAGDDFLHGGKGNDYLTGGTGADIYAFDLGDGDDTIFNNDAAGWRDDCILFGEGIAPEDIRASRLFDSLVLENVKSSDRITVANAFTDAGGANFIGKVEFADGTLWSPEDLKEMLRRIIGTEGNDRLTGFGNGYNYDLDEIFDGGDGNDTINAAAGNDIIYGGSGNDDINGWAGDDLIYGGSGNDNIQGGVGNDIIHGDEGNDTIQGWDGNDTIYGGEGDDIIYAGTGDDTVDGGEGDDTIDAGAGNDILHGGTGNDALYGGTGNDTYVFGVGDGQDTISDFDKTSGNADTLRMDAAARSIMFARAGADLLVSILGTPDQVIVKNWYLGDDYHVENIESGDGYSLAHAQVDQMIQAMASFGADSGMSWEDAVTAEDESVNQAVSQMWMKRGE